MTVRCAIATTVGATIGVAAIGAAVGCSLGTLVPDYYRSVFRNGQEPGFDPVSVGLGLGLTQGAIVGLAIGLSLIAFIGWREVRLRTAVYPNSPTAERSRRSSLALRVLLSAGVVVALGLFLGVGMVSGLLVGEQGAYHRQFLAERDAIAPVLAADPAFDGVELLEYSGGGSYLLGQVPTVEDLGGLRAAVVRAVGERRAVEVIRAVSVRP